MATLFGQLSDVTYNSSGGYSGDFAIATKLQAQASGNATSVQVNALAPCNARVGIFSDSGGNIGTLLNQTANVAVVSGINTISLPTTGITINTFYWLAICDDTTGGIGGSTAGTAIFWATIGNEFGTPTANSFSTTPAIIVLSAEIGSIGRGGYGLLLASG